MIIRDCFWKYDQESELVTFLAFLVLLIDSKLYSKSLPEDSHTYRAALSAHLALAQVEDATIVVHVAKVAVSLAPEGRLWPEAEDVLDSVGQIHHQRAFGHCLEGAACKLDYY